MRISDGSSDVCSSDLCARHHCAGSLGRPCWRMAKYSAAASCPALVPTVAIVSPSVTMSPASRSRQDRTSVVEGQRGSVSVDLGGRRLIKIKRIQLKKLLHHY